MFLRKKSFKDSDIHSIIFDGKEKNLLMEVCFVVENKIGFVKKKGEMLLVTNLACI